jgi:hypothetical protein
MRHHSRRSTTRLAAEKSLVETLRKLQRGFKTPAARQAAEALIRNIDRDIRPIEAAVIAADKADGVNAVYAHATPKLR